MKSIQLANPCSENWEQMQPAAQGKFCGRCQMQVHDMTALSTWEVIQLFQKNGGKLCGRLTETQLKQHNDTIEKQSIFRFSKITKSISAFSVVAMAFVTMPLKKSYATNNVVVTQPNFLFKESNFLPDEPPLDSARILKVKVVDEKGEAITGAAIILLNPFKKKLYSVKTNDKGNGIINIPNDYCALRINKIDKKEIIYDLQPNSDSVVFRMEEDCSIPQIIHMGGFYPSNKKLEVIKNVSEPLNLNEKKGSQILWKRILFFPYYQTRRLYRRVRNN